MEVSAQVILRAKGPITAETVKQNQPSKEAVEAVRDFFSRAGFELGPFVGTSFSITRAASSFDRTFKTKLSTLKGYELPLENLPNHIRKEIEAITFTPPPAFGPGGSGP